MQDRGKNRRETDGSWKAVTDGDKKIRHDGDKKIRHAKIGIGERMAKLGIGNLGIGSARTRVGRSGKTGHPKNGLDLHRASNALRAEARTRART